MRATVVKVFGEGVANTPFITIGPGSNINFQDFCARLNGNAIYGIDGVYPLFELSGVTYSNELVLFILPYAGTTATPIMVGTMLCAKVRRV